LLTDILFLRAGKIALAATMDEVAERFTEVMVPPEHAAAARALGPLDERTVFGKSIFLFDGIPRPRLAELGELRTPNVADLFVATMKGTYA
ncbi:ABC transporter ATP-binding protein, partial [Xanthomonadaceae bacterium JHOS43]|nr:ABC transporter ATP-binding protein [Xanthomonadaceae bacterium JHOS43]